MPRFATLPPLSLYVHLPWCERKCPYCDFNSHPLKTALPEQDYVDALLSDLEQELPDVWGRPVISVFLGGGTPSLFSVASINKLLSGIRARLPLVPDCEVTLEANPGSAEAVKFSGFRAAGVNRISIGVQSFNDNALGALGRIHNGRQALTASVAAREAGFGNINLDLMHGLPGQTAEGALADLDQALDCQPSHLSCYQLTIEPNTLFHHKPPTLPDEDEIWAMQETIQRRLGAAGFAQYEVSAYARQAAQCRHNLNYWRFGDYLGIGAGAHGKLTLPDRVLRRHKLRHPQAYMAAAASARRISGEERLDGPRLAFEFLLNHLRLREPLPASRFQQRTGGAIAAILPQLQQAVADGLMDWDGARASTTERGFRFLNELLERFLPAPAA